MKAPTSGPALLLVNPASGRGRGLKHLEQTAAALHAAGYTPVVHITESLQEATDRARGAAAGTLVAVLGGDGFLGAAAAGARDSGAVLLPLAGGRGNDTIRRLGLDLDPAKTVRKLPRLVVRELDLGLVNGRAYLGVANVGFDGLANEYGNSARINLGPFVYLYGGLKAFLEWRNVTFTLTVDGAQSTVPGWFVAVGNVGQYGGGLHICPQARVDDGLLDVVALGRATILGVALTFLRSYRGTHLRQRNITFSRGSEITISASKPLNIYADGENVGPLPATISIAPAAVKVLVPADSPVFG
ncbi:diacylglycerol/lipid kinase family protein [Paeniglutamicibacter psychrophenolicus]|uniref:YegS/Rv2252/BmrU family lipid kinase n=1 Tax=Paeniglutamicibacter psychrophenolicus TaxID=257454 RepID=A0ABS4WE97_9MICC|nr:diacylglycerol kinase family protein [Paeniglutamicibacter psychrophenolicus]MBP2374539.1 YegS/Rv2252/BmrU family lipid kinase [Paeniglutamicibacter psychrophenolicus]